VEVITSVSFFCLVSIGNPNATLFQQSVAAQTRHLGMEAAKSRAMTLELISEGTGRKYDIKPKVLGKLLHLARLEGWEPERVSPDWPSESWETSIILPHLGPYMPGRVSRADAEGLRIALTRALATGSVAAEGSVQYAAGTLLQVAREGSFRVRLCQIATHDTKLLFAAIPA
jgi:hypothetical protein